MVLYELRLNYINGVFEEVFVNSDGYAVVDTPLGLLIVVGYVHGYNNYKGTIKNKKLTVSHKSINQSQEIVNKENNLIKTFIEDDNNLYVYIQSIERIFRNRGYETTLVTETTENGITNIHVDLSRPHLYLPNFDIDFIKDLLVELEEKDFLTKEALDRIYNYVRDNPDSNMQLEGDLS